MAAEGNDDLPVPDLRTMEELCQPSLHGRGGPISPIAIWATNFGLKNDMIQKKAKMFIEKYFPPSMVTKLINEITNFRQRLDESLFEAWERGTFMKRHPKECYDLIENMTDHHNDWDTSAQRSKSSSSITSSSDTEIAALKAKMAEINKNLTRVLRVNQQVKSVTSNCETCGDPHSFSNCPSTIGNTQNVYAAATYQGNSYQPQANRNLLNYRSDNYLGPPGFNQNQNRNNQNHNFHNQNRNQGNYHPQGNNQGRNQFFQGANQGQNQPPAYQAPAYQVPVYQASVHQPQIPHPQVVTTNEFTNFMKFMKMNTALSPGLGTLPERETETTKEMMHPTNNEITEDIQPPLVLQKPDQRPSIPYPSRFQDQKLRDKANDESLADLEANINLMPLFVWNQLSLPDLSPTCMSLELVDRLISRPVGVAENFFVKVGTFHFPADFIVVDFDANPRVPLILGRSFLKTVRALIDVFEGKLTLRVGKEAITFNLDQTSRYSANYNDMTANRIDVIDMACEEYSQEVLGFSDVITEVDAFLALKDDPTSPEVDQYYLDSEGDILLLDAFLNDDPLLPLPNQGNYLRKVRKEQKICEAKPDKSSIDEPPEEKTTLITVIKSHKRAITWKLSNIKGIDPEICTHKILMEEDFEPAPSTLCTKKGGFTVVENEDNELILIRLVMGWRVYIDYRKLNEATRKDHFPLPFMDQMLERIAGNQYYCFLDDFSRCMMAIFYDMIEKTMKVFIDDFLVFENSFQSCLSHLEKMLKRCEDTNLCLNWEKSHFMFKEGIVLGYKIYKEGIEVDKAKVNVITKLPHPTTIKGIRIFLGHVGFYRRFIKDFSKIARLMTHLLEKDTPFLFSKECVEAFQTHKRKLIEAPILIAPDWDMPFELMYDASDFAIEIPVLSHHEQEHCVYGPFRLQISLCQEDSKARLLHWALLLQEFTFKVIDTKGAENLAADHLSRLENPHQNVLDPKEINESFPLETLNLVSIHGKSSTPWFADFANYHAGNFFVKGMSSQQKNLEPRYIINDRGTHFCNDQFAKVMQKFGVTHHLATPYHPQTSGQVEVSNRGLKPYKIPIGCTPYKLVYGKACYLLIELEYKAYWALKHAKLNLQTASDHKKVQLNELNELRDQAYEDTLIYKEKTKRLNDSKIKDRVFNIGDRVLLFNSRLKIFSSKLKSHWSVPFTISHVFPYGTVELSQPNGPNFKVNGHRLKHYFGEDVPKIVVPDL
uniref:Reverse transcriptase domain-containing protein n=1 Tax=Tanacetum cinerariifolium TaxID=118510 RepID=A0A6L2L7P3_TANCI|nr:reverse transcriptase domain-containing protein [Tanacetum cinerariifolium]